MWLILVHYLASSFFFLSEHKWVFWEVSHIKWVFHVFWEIWCVFMHNLNADTIPNSKKKKKKRYWSGFLANVEIFWQLKKTCLASCCFSLYTSTSYMYIHDGRSEVLLLNIYCNWFFSTIICILPIVNNKFHYFSVCNSMHTYCFRVYVSHVYSDPRQFNVWYIILFHSILFVFCGLLVIRDVVLFTQQQCWLLNVFANIFCTLTVLDLYVHLIRYHPDMYIWRWLNELISIFEVFP